jgi:hypothetical protein
MHDKTLVAITDAHGPEEAAHPIERGRGLTFDQVMALVNAD